MTQIWGYDDAPAGGRARLPRRSAHLRSCALVLAGLLLPSCYVAHGADAPTGEAGADRDGGATDSHPRWSLVATVPSEVRGSTFRGRYDVVALPDGTFVVLSVARGIIAARFDQDAQIMWGPVLTPSPEHTESVVGMATADEVVVFDEASDEVLRVTRFAFDGTVVAPRRELRHGLSDLRSGLEITRRVDGSAILSYLVEEDAVLFQALDPGGRPFGPPRELFDAPNDTRLIGVADDGERAHATWYEHVPEGPSRLFTSSVGWDGTDASEPRLLRVAEPLGGFISAPTLLEERFWAVRHGYDVARLLPLDEPDEELLLGEFRYHPPSVHSLPDGPAALIVVEADPLSAPLVFQPLDLSTGPRGEPFEVQDSSWSTWHFDAAVGPTAFAVIWIGAPVGGSRELRVRVRRH